jgi:hypothetical protein
MPGTDSLHAPTERRLSCAMRLFALVLSDGPLALDLFASSRDAETAFAQVVREEPAFRQLLEIRELTADTALDPHYRLSFNQRCAIEPMLTVYVPAEAAQLEIERLEVRRDC